MRKGKFIVSILTAAALLMTSALAVSAADAEESYSGFPIVQEEVPVSTDHVIPSADPNFVEMTLDEFQELYPDYEGVFPEDDSGISPLALEDPGYVTAKYDGPFEWVQEGSKWYLYSGTGSSREKVTLGGWYQDGNYWYCLYPSGATKYDGSTATGEMITGWEKIRGYWYYFNEYGQMATYWKEVSGVYYYFSPSGADAISGYPEGAMITGEHYLPYTQGSSTYLNYYFSSSGAMQDWHYPLPEELVSGVPSTSYEPYYVTSRFAEWRVIDGQNNQHNGLDLRAKVPIEVESATNGEVIYAQYNPDMGNLVVVKSDVQAPNGNPLYIRYMHLSSIDVEKDDIITEKTLIGETGNTGGVDWHFHMDVNAFNISTSEVTASNGQNPAAFFTTVPWAGKHPYGEEYSGYVD